MAKKWRLIKNSFIIANKEKHPNINLKLRSLNQHRKFGLLAGRTTITNEDGNEIHLIVKPEKKKLCIIDPKTFYYCEIFNNLKNTEFHGPEASNKQPWKNVWNSYFRNISDRYDDLNNKNNEDLTLAILLILPLLDLYIKDNQG